jgi:hypothetical protein
MKLSKATSQAVEDNLANAWLLKNFGRFMPETREELGSHGWPASLIQTIRRLREIPEKMSSTETSVFQRAWSDEHFGEKSPANTIQMMMQIPEKRFQQAMAEFEGMKPGLQSPAVELS